MARRRSRRLIEGGRVELQLADSARIPYPDGIFDRVYATHTLYFWVDPQKHLREISRVMKKRARFVLGFGSKDDEQAVANFPATIYRFYTSDEVRLLLKGAGFARVHMVHHRISSRRVVFGVAHRGASQEVSMVELPHEAI